MRTLPLLALLGCAPTPLPLPDTGAPDTARPTASPDDAPPPAPDDAPPASDDPSDAPSEPDSPPVEPEPPVDCGPIAARSGTTLCASDADTCAAVFTDGAGCDAVCASAGLGCLEVWEDLPGQCAADASRPPLSCAPASGHQSDYCVCGGPYVPPPVDCTVLPHPPAALLAERVGFGAAAEGGDPNLVYRVTTLADSGAGSLRAALESTSRYWVVFEVSGEITLSSPIVVRSHKTVDGRGSEITVNGNLRFQDTRNVIVNDVRLTNDQEAMCGQVGDVVTIFGTGGTDPATYTSRDLWFHHVEFFRGGDGLLDIRGGSRITVSWSHFHSHMKGLLQGRTWDDEPAPGMAVTYHHNFFDRISLRGPQFLFGKAHYFNNYQYHWYEYGAASLGGAEFYSEANVYEARPGLVCLPFPCPDPNTCGGDDLLVSKQALVTDWATNGTGSTKSVGDLALNGAIITVNQASQVFDPADHYTWTAEPATTALADRIRDESGPRTTCP